MINIIHIFIKLNFLYKNIKMEFLFLDLISEFSAVCYINSNKSQYQDYFLIMTLLESLLILSQKYDAYQIIQINFIISRLLLAFLEYNTKIYLTVMFLLMQFYCYQSKTMFLDRKDFKIFFHMFYLLLTGYNFYSLKTCVMIFFMKVLTFTPNQNIQRCSIIYFILISFALDRIILKN